MDVFEATDAYEAWLGSQTPLVPKQLEIKHRTMAESAFVFLRGTFYLWALRWDELCPELSAAPSVTGVGDLHVENYGTWRDGEGRLVWGVNDFDEATVLPYTVDLVRLVTSAVLAAGEERLAVGPKAAADSVLDSYAAAMGAGGSPFVLEEHHARLGAMASTVLRDPAAFWKKVEGAERAGDVPAELTGLLAAALPSPHRDPRFMSRIAGVGSLGRIRVTAVATCYGSLVAREAKATAPSAWDWAHDPQHAARTDAARGLLAGPLRDPDPCVQMRDGWIIRRLAPYCTGLGLETLPKKRDEEHLLGCMGREVANVHLVTQGARDSVLADLAVRPKGWLRAAAVTMADSVRADWKRWAKRNR